MEVKMMVHICEVGPRDGLQNEAVALTVSQRVSLIEKLIQSGIKKIEAVSFVNPKIIPQMALAEEVMKNTPKHKDVTYAGLVLNQRGLERALHTSIDVIHLSLAASNTFNLKNSRKSTKDSLLELTNVIKTCTTIHMPVVAIIGTFFGCPYEGHIDEKAVLHIIDSFVEAGCKEITLADTTGLASPLHIRNWIQVLQTHYNKAITIGLHLHNTRGLALANILAAYEMGVTHFDSSIGGLGGCPFAPKAVGNVCTEDLINMFHQMNIKTGIDLETLLTTNLWLEEVIKHPLPGMVAKAGIPFKKAHHKN
ncbi:MAG: hydroxymethylglutaryl-CoA lyase [Bacillaceae bacterium]